MNGIYSFIINPETGRRVSINGKIGKKILKNYLDNFQFGGWDPLGTKARKKKKEQKEYKEHINKYIKWRREYEKKYLTPTGDKKDNWVYKGLHPGVWCNSRPISDETSEGNPLDDDELVECEDLSDAAFEQKWVNDNKIEFVENSESDKNIVSRNNPWHGITI